jgi:RNA polymerase sigma-70 factor (TIGR02957 family)
VISTFETERSRLFGLAYRMLGSAEEAEDVVQEAFLRWDAADRDTIENPQAWLTKVVTNLSLNQLTSARARRERYVGTWLPEPVLTTNGAMGPEDTVEQRNLVSLGLLVLLEQLTPVERAVFVLREAFGHSHREIASLIDVSEANSRQLHHRARQRIDPSRPATPTGQAGRRLAEKFFAAAQQGDLAGLEALLSAEATSWADGGGKATAARRPVVGREKVARYFAGLAGKWLEGVEVRLAEVNGEPAVLGRHDGTLLGMLAIQVEGDQITALRVVSNPDKLLFLDRQTSRKDAGHGSNR